MRILVAGGAGYIGSHACVELIGAGHDVIVIDNLINSSRESIKRVEQITEKRIVFYEGDCLDTAFLEDVFEKESIDAVINFAGLKAVGESVEKPLQYYNNNIAGMLNLLQVMEAYSIKNIIFSSSATVYGETSVLPVCETAPLGQPTNPYGQTKLMLEQILVDLCKSDPEWNAVLLRYFNPIGAHESGLIGEDPSGTPNNLIPYVSQVAIGKRPFVSVFGNDYDTPDGTGVRDYIHVVDLAKGHVAALQKFGGVGDGSATGDGGLYVYNLGTGKGYSVLEVIDAFKKASGREIPYEIKSRRAGDIAISYCDAGKAERELGWKAEKTLEDMCADAWRWQSMNPDGYEE